MWRDFNNIADMRQILVTNSAIPLPPVNVASGEKTPERVIVQALSTNTAPCFIKNASDVAVGGTSGGHELPAGSNIILPLTGGHYKEYYIIASAGTQSIQLTYLAE